LAAGEATRHSAGREIQAKRSLNRQQGRVNGFHGLTISMKQRVLQTVTGVTLQEVATTNPNYDDQPKVFLISPLSLSGPAVMIPCGVSDTI